MGCGTSLAPTGRAWFGSAVLIVALGASPLAYAAASPSPRASWRADPLFAPAVPLDAPGAECVGVGDLNHDGHPDLAVASYIYEQNATMLSIFLGNGDGTF